ncbi:MAG: hypothetical protein M0R80_01930 [Proteobacteria bacterium]|jgi:hypothetical protein|nr:hypothetical protein [Pseudomonadota bacterium]
MKAWVKNSYLDGGTVLVLAENNEVYYIDHRIGSTTDGLVFDHYPDDGVEPLDITLEVVGKWEMDYPVRVT